MNDAISPGDAAAIRDDFPEIADSGLLPVEATRPGGEFRELIEEMQSEPRLPARFSEKFGVDLVGRPKMITVRGRCAAKDGRIHTDSETKLVTVLIYFNEAWEAQGRTAAPAALADRSQRHDRRGPAGCGHDGRVPPLRQLLSRPRAV